MGPRLALNLQSFCFSLLRGKIIGMPGSTMPFITLAMTPCPFRYRAWGTLGGVIRFENLTPAHQHTSWG